MDQKKVGQFLKELRREKQITQEQLASEFNVSSRTVSRWETGSNLPDISLLADIADFYNVDVRELIEGGRKSEMMDKEIKEVAEKMADYAGNEKSRLLKTVQIVSFFGVIASLISIWFQTAEHTPGNLISRGAITASLIALIVMTFMTLYVTGLLEKIMKHKVLFGTVKVVTIAALVYGVFRVLLFTSLIGLLLFDSVFSRIKVNDDPQTYSEYIHNPENSDYLTCDGEMFGIFPESIDNASRVVDYQCTYYNPWDPQYVVYLTAEYDDAAYEAETDRLRKFGIEDYKGIYTVTDEPSGYDIVAMDSDTYYGFVYAMVPESGEKEITYVALWFCNYFYDLDVNKYIPKQYLLPGFDATSDNPYLRKMMKKDVNNVEFRFEKKGKNIRLIFAGFDWRLNG